MREIPRPAPAGPGAEADLGTEARRLGDLLRVGYTEPALSALSTFTGRVTPALGDLKRRGESPPLQTALGLLETLSLAQARGDLVAVADILEHQLAPLLDTAVSGRATG